MYSLLLLLAAAQAAPQPAAAPVETPAPAYEAPEWVGLPVGRLTLKDRIVACYRRCTLIVSGVATTWNRPGIPISNGPTADYLSVFQQPLRPAATVPAPAPAPADGTPK
jgi:hypothetical protein